MSDSCPVVSVRIPALLRELTEGRSVIEIDARSVDEAFEAIRKAEPLLAGRMFGDDGRLRGFVNVFVNGTEYRRLGPDDREMEAGTVLTIVPSVAGG